MPMDYIKIHFQRRSASTYQNQETSDTPDLLNVQIQAFKEFLQEDDLLMKPKRYRDAGCIFEEFSYYRFQGNCAS